MFIKRIFYSALRLILMCVSLVVDGVSLCNMAWNQNKKFWMVYDTAAFEMISCAVRIWV